MALRTKSNLHLGCRTGCRTKTGLCHQTARIVCASGARPGRPCIVRNRRRRIDGRAESRSFLRAYFRTSPSHHRPTGIGAPRAARVATIRFEIEARFDATNFKFKKRPTWRDAIDVRMTPEPASQQYKPSHPIPAYLPLLSPFLRSCAAPVCASR